MLFRKSVKRLFFIFFFLFFTISGFPVVQALASEEGDFPELGAGGGDSEKYFFGPGDILDIRVYGEPEVSSKVVVRLDGRISLPLAGELRATGVTPEDLSENIRARLERYIESPAVTVMLVESRSKTYYILGQIQSPGEYDMSRSITVLQAIARAGGFLEWAKKDRIMIVGEAGATEKVTYFDYDQFLRRGDSKRNVLISPGDTIVIP